MVNATQKRLENYTDPSLVLLLSPSLQKLAKQLYCTYMETHYNQIKHPFGLVINPVNYRACLIFSHQPILLPSEFFIPIELIESKIY